MLVSPSGWFRFAGRWLATRFTVTRSSRLAKAGCSAATLETRSSGGTAGLTTNIDTLSPDSTTECPTCKQQWVLHNWSDSTGCYLIDCGTPSNIPLYYPARVSGSSASKRKTQGRYSDILKSAE